MDYSFMQYFEPLCDACVESQLHSKDAMSFCTDAHCSADRPGARISEMHAASVKHSAGLQVVHKTRDTISNVTYQQVSSLFFVATA